MKSVIRTAVSPTALIGWGALAASLLIARFPAPAFEASLKGLSIWWEVLFPALLPFFIISELMLGFGVVHFIGRLLDPLMRPMFRLPGIGGFVVAMGYVSGYPVGARLAAQLWDQKLITRTEGERLIAFTTTSDPIFLIGAVSVGFFHEPALAPVLAVSHYGAGLIVGLLMRFHRGDKSEEEARPRHQSGAARSSAADGRKRGRLAQAFLDMHQARLEDGRAIGTLLRDAVQSGLRLMIVVGGLVVFFSVLMEVLRQSGVVGALSSALAEGFRYAGVPEDLTGAIVNGLFEVTLGSQSAGSAGAPLMFRAAAAVWVLSWAGLSVHAQIASLVGHTGMRYLPFLAARFVHSLLAVALLLLLWGVIGP